MTADGKFQVRNSKAAIMTAEKVMDARREYAAGYVTQAELSRKYGITTVQMGRILRGESWTRLPAVISDEEIKASEEKFFRENPDLIPPGMNRLAAEVKIANKGNVLLDELAAIPGKPAFDE